MEKQLNVKLAFNADTSRAQAQIQTLQQSLNNVGMSTVKLPITKEIQEAQIAANQLKVAMNSAFNVDTGKIDLLKFNQSIQKSGTNLVEIRNRLMQIGPAGQQAFLSLAQSIASAEIPARRTSKLLGDLGVTLKNTIKWQFSSSMMHGFMGAVQSAYGYAQNLNKSLNNIRIVTGLSADEMDKFALKANKAAKELSASTLDYTNASLIYYQQGLNDQQVKERTDVTIKMANATGTTAEKVSQQMTAVWNNFDDGSKSLEYYADVMTALGAATASSTDEISQGLQKFAAVASTVGLSYEYATSALATITATTRESADSVGTALKTLFARIQGLKMGETLEDGVDLNKYSAALRSIGVEVLTANGDLREMDDILNDMGERWKTLTDAQKASTAQSVAGVRQYTQLIALMDNWDFFQSNLGVANSATGTLQEQADIYAESWEAASKRVKAAWEAVYTDLLNDDFFIGVTNALEKVLTLFDGFLDSIGGAKGLLFGLSSILLNTFSGQAAAGLENMVYNFKSFVGIAQKEAIHTQNYMNELAKQPFMAGQTQTTEPQPVTVSTKTSVMSGEQAILQTIAQQKEHMNEIQQQESQAILEQTRMYGEQAMILAQKAEAAKASHEATRSELMDVAITNGADNAREAFNSIDDDIEFSQIIEREVQEIIQALEQGENETDEFKQKLSNLLDLKDKATARGMGPTVGKNLQRFHNLARRKEIDETKIEETKQFGTKTVDSGKRAVNQKARNSFKNMGLEEKQADDYVKSQKRVSDATNKATDAVNKHGQAVEEGRNRIQGFSNATMSVSEGMVKAASCATSLSFALTQITNLGNIWSNETLTGGQKLLQTLTSLGMMLPMLMNIFTNFSSITNALATSQNFLNTAAAAYAATQKGGLATMQAETLAKQTGMSLDQAQIAINNAKVIAKMKEIGLTKAKIGAMTAEQLAEKTGMTLEQASIIIAKVKAGATVQQAMAEAGLTSSLWAQVAAWIAAQTAMTPVLAITLLIVAAMVALAAVIAGVVIIVKAISNAYNADAIAAQKAAEAAKELAERYKTVKQEYEDMISAMENYQTAREGLDNLTRGTEEYQEALKEANRLALELITTYGLIEGQGYEWQGDELLIHDDAMKQVKNKKSQELDIAYAANQMAQVNAREKQSQNKQTNLRRDIKDDNGIGNGDRIAIAIGDAIVGTLGIALAGVTHGASLMATAWAVNHTAQLEKSATKYEEAIDKAVEEARTNEKLFTSKEIMAEALNIDLNDTKLIEALWSNREAIQNLSNEINANTEAEKIAAQNSANEIMMDSGYQNSESGRMTLEAGGEVYQQLYNDAEKTYLDTKMAGFFGRGTKAGKDMWAKYAEETGLSELNGYKVIDYRKDGGVEYEYIDENNKKQTGIATAEMIAQTLAAADAAGQLEGALSQLRNVIANLNASKDLGDHALADFLSTGNLEGATQAEFNDLRTDAGFIKNADGSISYDETAVNNMLGLTGDAVKDLEIAKSRGYESAQAYKDAFIKSMDVDWQIPEGFKHYSEELTLGAVKNIENTIEQMGSEGGKAYIDTMNQIASGEDWDNLTNDEQIDMMNRLANIDWTSWDAGEQAIAIAKEYGVSIDTTSEAWQNNIKVMRDASNALPDMKALAADMKKLKDISDDIDLGKILSQEDYELLVKYNRELGNYFTILSDGSAQFIGDKLDFKQESEGTQKAHLEESIKAQQDRLTEIRAQYKAGADAVGGASNLDQYRDTEHYVGENGKNYYQGKNVQTQIDFLRSQGYDEEQLSAWEKDLEDGETTVETLNQIAEAVNTTADAFNGLGQEAINAEGMIQTTMNELALTADNAAERQQMLEEGSINEAAYGQAAMAAINEEKWEDMDADEVEQYADHLQEIAAESELLVDDLTEEAAEDVALYTKKMNKGISKLAEGFEEWNSVLKNSDESSEEYSKAMGEMKDAMSDVLGTSEEFISNSFITENLKDIEKAAQGDAEAIDRLRQALSKDILCNIMAVDNFDELNGRVKDFHNQIATLDTDIKVGATLETGDFTKAAQGIVDAAGMTVEQAQAYFNSLGYEPEFIMQNEKRTAPMYGKRVYTDDPVIKYAPDGYGGQFPYIAAMTTHEEQVYMGEQEQNFVVPALSANGTPQIKSLTKTSSGAMNNGSSSNKGGKGTGGGGGGGSGKAPQKKNDSEKERYHTIKNQLEDLRSEYEEIGKAKSRAFGQDKLNAMDAEIHKTDELIKKQEKYIDAISKDLPVDKAVMEAYYKDVIGNGTPIEFDVNGNISNYDAIQDAMFKKYNSMAESNTDDSETWKVFEEKYKQLEEYIEQYEETYDLLREEEAAYQELINQRMDLELEKIQYVVELKLNISEDDMAILEYQFDLLEDRAFAAAKRITELTKQAENIYDQIQFNQQGLEETLALSGASMEDIFNGNIEGFTFTENQIDAIKEYRDNLLDLNTQLIDAQKQIEEQVIEAFDEFHDELDKGMEKFDHYNTMLESYRNIVDIVGKDVLKLDNGQIAKITSAQVDNSIRQLNAARDAYDTYRAAADDAKAKMDEYKAKVDNTNNKALKDSYQQDYEFWKQSYEEMDSSAREAQEELMDTWGSTLEAVVSQFEMAVEAAVETFNDAIYQLGGLEGLSNEFSMIKEKDDMLLDDYQKIYELSKLTRDINNSIDDTDNIGGKQKLKKLLQDINKLQEDGVEISQYDLEYLQKTYDLRLAELELEEAQRAKNTVRLSRDNEGNWSYIYTQNTDAVDAAQQKYEDALYAMQDLSSNYIDEMSEKLISTSQDMLAAISELRVEDFASQEDYYKEILRIEKLYKDQMAAQEIELNNAINNNKILYNTDWKNYSEATGYKISAAEDFATAFKDTLLGSLMDSEENTSTFTEFIGKATEQLTGELNQIAGTYYANIGNAMETAGTKTGDFAEMLEENIAVIQSESKKAAEAVANMAEQMDNDFIDIMDNVARWQEDYGREIDKIINKNELLINSFNDMIKALSGDMNEIDIRYNISSNTEAEEATGSGEATVPEGTVSGATGMYTGNWNSKEGRVAVLHQKELLLNENDTSNFLTAIKITRAMLETIDLNARQASFGLGNLVPSSVKDEKTQTLEQAVHITAEFPNVSDHNEIEQAFTNLINTASQYANRK